VIGPNAMPSKRFEITDEEHAARQVCKILGARGLQAEELKAEWLVIQQETSGRVRSGLGEQGWDKALQGAASRGWIAERDGQYFATEARRFDRETQPCCNRQVPGSAAALGQILAASFGLRGPFLVGGHPLPEFSVVEEHLPDGFAGFGRSLLAGLFCSNAKLGGYMCLSWRRVGSVGWCYCTSQRLGACHLYFL
jgi:hypothetical protein